MRGGCEELERSLEKARRESTEARASNSALKRERDEFAGGCVELEASVEATSKKLRDAEARLQAQRDDAVKRDGDLEEVQITY